MELHHFSQDCTSSGKGAENQITQTLTNWYYKSWKCSRHDSSAKLMNLKRGKLGTCGLEGIKGYPAKPPEID